jgi:hypothetical protein
MNWVQFRSNLASADEFRSLAQGMDADYWTGYIRGLRRLYSGERFGTLEEHASWMAAADCTDEVNRIRGMGYRIGYEGRTVQEALQDLVRV